jgi:hypothetical protein
MYQKISLIGAVAALALAANVQDTQAFSPVAFVPKTSSVTRFAEEGKPSEAVFVPETEAPVEETIGLETVELLGKGAAKVRILCFRFHMRN